MELDEFAPDIIHVVSPGDVNEIGVLVARRRKLPLAISGHTNLYEFGALRLARMLDRVPEKERKSVVEFSEAQILNAMPAFYRMGDVWELRPGHVGRITRRRTSGFLRERETGLRDAGTPPVRFPIAGDGSETGMAFSEPLFGRTAWNSAG